MKKGLLFVPFMTGHGGTETVIKNLFDVMTTRRLSYKIKLVSIGGSNDYNWARSIDADIEEISSKKLIRTMYYTTCLPFKIFRYVKNESPDFIISTNPVMWFLAKWSVKVLHRKTPIIAWYHYSFAQKPIKQIFLKAADYYLAISSGIKQELIANGISSRQIFLVYNPVETDHKMICRPKKSTKFVFVGRPMLDGQKNMRELFDALSGVKGSWLLSIYGTSDKITEAQKYTQTLGIQNNVIWKGFSKNVWDSIGNATALILTSKYEGLPMVLCEAISHGLYCVSADIQTGPEDIINADNGLLYKSGNVNQLTQILQTIVDNGIKVTSEKIQETSEKFTPTVYLDRFNNAILEICENK